MNSRNIHVTPRPEGWATKPEGASRASRIYPTQRKAIDAARHQTQQNGGELVIHNRQGQIRAKDSHGPDKCPPRGYRLGPKI